MEQLNEFIDEAGKAAFGMTRTEAVEGQKCICCHKNILLADGKPDPTMFFTMAGIKEWHISGMCEKCFDNLFSDEEARE